MILMLMMLLMMLLMKLLVCVTRLLVFGMTAVCSTHTLERLASSSAPSAAHRTLFEAFWPFPTFQKKLHRFPNFQR